MSERWMPKHGELYYYVSTTRTVTPEKFNKHDVGKIARCFFGNCFRTAVEAESVAEKFKAFQLSFYEDQPVTECSQLPDWVEVGGYVYDARNGYGKIVSGSVKSCYIEFDGGAGDFVPEAFAELKQARLRPYNDEEMKALVGKVIEFDAFAQLVLMYDGKDNAILAGDGDWISESTLLKDYTIDNKPAGVLEHLENGEWVK